MNYKDYIGIESFLRKAKNIILSTHSNPDGDTLGSALGLYHFLNKIGIPTQIISPELASENLRWLPSYDIINIFKENPVEVQKLIMNADLIVHIDYNAFHRTGDDVAKVLKQALQANHIMIDHHPNPQDGFDAYISDPSACATAQLVFNLNRSMNANLTKDAATCLYTGIITDTGSFSYGMEDEQPYLVAAELVKQGINDKWIHQKIYSSNSLNRLRLLGYAMSQKLVIIEEERWAFISLSKEELQKYHYQSGDTEGLVNDILSINNLVAAVLLSEKEGKIRLSFRSKANFEVNIIARENFEGGGHLNAAGGNSFENMELTIHKLKRSMHQYREQLIKIEL